MGDLAACRGAQGDRGLRGEPRMSRRGDSGLTGDGRGETELRLDERMLGKSGDVLTLTSVSESLRAGGFLKTDFDCHSGDCAGIKTFAE